MGGVYTTYWGIIDVQDNVFIGAHSTILSNVTIGSNVVVAAGSLVNRDVPEGKVVAGVPARVIADTSDLAKQRRAYSDSLLGKLKGDERLRCLWEQRNG